MNAGEKIRVALFGCGWVQDFHARAVLQHPGAELVAVANHREETARAFARRHGIDRVTTDWEALAADPGIEAVVVATPNALHAPQTVVLLQAGKDVLVEKPMAVTVAECEAMLDAARYSTRSLMVAHCWRFHPNVVAMRDRVASGEFGEIVKTRSYGVHVGTGPEGWFTDPSLSGGGALLDMGVHGIDTARFLLGNPMPVRVRAEIGTSYADGRYTVDDDDIVLIAWSNGTRSIVESGWWQPHTGGIEAETEVYGTRGYGRIWQPDMREGHDELALQPMYSAQMAEFLTAIENGQRPQPTGEDGRTVMQVVEDAYRSATA